MSEQRVLVTAGACGIGLAVAHAFVENGARVHIADLDVAAVAAATENTRAITGTVCDVSDPAGVSGPTAPVEEYDPHAWKTIIAINLTATFTVTQKAVPPAPTVAWHHGQHDPSRRGRGSRIERVLAGRADLSGNSVDEERTEALGIQSIKSFVDPADIGAPAVFLTGEHGRSISGQILPSDGDSKATQ